MSMLFRVSAAWARIELGCAALLAVCVTILILINVITRTAGNALYWIDELAIYAMVWMTFLGASSALHHRNAISITILTDAVPEQARRAIVKLVDIIVFAFALAMVWFCWRWFLPLDIASAGFDRMAFQGSTFNFIYSEPTLTLGLPKYLFWLAMWLFALGALLHSTMHVFAAPTQRDVS
jgi:TRAP-type C4-dicarboxylate transport system permease small subunit